MSHQCCIQCSKTSDKAWMTILNEGETTHLCSYLCYRRGRDKYPKKLWPLIQNKEDFDDIRPIQMLQLKTKSFQFLNYDELLQLPDEEVGDYYDNLDDHMTLNPMVSEIHHEQEQEDRRVRELEDEWETSSVGSYSDP